MEFQSLTAEGKRYGAVVCFACRENKETHWRTRLKGPTLCKVYFTSFFARSTECQQISWAWEKVCVSFFQKLSVQKTDKVICDVRTALKPPPAQWHHCRAKVEGGCQQRAKYAVIWRSILANPIKLLRWREMEVQEITLDLNVSYLNRSTWYVYI